MNNHVLDVIKKLNKLGVFYKDGEKIETLPLDELEYYYITKKCEMVKIMQRQKKSQPAGNKLTFA